MNLPAQKTTGHGLAGQGNAAAAQKLPLIYWTQGIETAQKLKDAGVEQIAVPPDKAGVWRKAGFEVFSINQEELERRDKLLVPRLAGRANVASATRRPWIDANGWRFIRNPTGRFYYDLPPRKAALAAAEAFAYSADAILKIDPADLEDAGKMLTFLRGLPQVNLEPVADFAFIDDGSPLSGEVINLLVRRNLLFRILPTASPQFAVNVKIGTKEFPETEAADPSAFAQKLRLRLTDEKRILRLYGSEVVIGRLTGDGSRIKLRLLNYGNTVLEGLRVRLRGSYGKPEANFFGYGREGLEDFAVTGGATEFSIARLGIYAEIGLTLIK